jgi:hypothetical protein
LAHRYDVPLRYASLSADRFLMLWFNWKDRAAYGDQNGKLYDAIVLQQVMLMALAAIGLCRTWPRSWPLAWSILVVTLLHMATISRMRFILTLHAACHCPGRHGSSAPDARREAPSSQGSR